MKLKKYGDRFRGHEELPKGEFFLVRNYVSYVECAGYSFWELSHHIFIENHSEYSDCDEFFILVIVNRQSNRQERFFGTEEEMISKTEEFLDKLNLMASPMVRQ